MSDCKYFPYSQKIFENSILMLHNFPSCLNSNLPEDSPIIIIIIRYLGVYPFLIL